MSEETWKVIQDLQHKLSVSRQQLQRQENHLHRLVTTIDLFVLSHMTSIPNSESSSDSKSSSEIGVPVSSLWKSLPAFNTDVLISQDDMSEETWKVIQDLQHKLSVSRQQLQRQENHLHRLVFM
jgi:uncharacterized alpha-E superfamily protein